MRGYVLLIGEEFCQRIWSPSPVPKLFYFVLNPVVGLTGLQDMGHKQIVGAGLFVPT